MMSMIQEFKEFAMKGNVVDLAVGVIIGGGFGKITTSLVEDVIMPPIGLLIGGIDFSQLKLVMKAATDTTEAVSINYGSFIQVVFNFLIIAFSVFMIIKALNSLKRSEAAAPEAAPEAPPRQEQLLEEILHALKKN
jgi:large conductance mechanosensitive channel